ncbi:hypothetical protein RZS08_31410, partial [Arthrospira platensis SPKY1]|nr:hypothetical protein [Arthrospira platensis SPKY1]
MRALFFVRARSGGGLAPPLGTGLETESRRQAGPLDVLRLPAPTVDRFGGQGHVGAVDPSHTKVGDQVQVSLLVQQALRDTRRQARVAEDLAIRLQAPYPGAGLQFDIDP